MSAICVNETATQKKYCDQHAFEKVPEPRRVKRMFKDKSNSIKPWQMIDIAGKCTEKKTLIFCLISILSVLIKSKQLAFIRFIDLP